MAGASVWHGLRAIFLLGLGLGAQAQSGFVAPLAPFPLAQSPLALHQRSASLQPFTVAGPCGAVVGQGDGSFEAWSWPVKLLSHFRISAQVKDYTVPIDVNEQSAEITVQPDHTTITFAHAAFTLREIVVASQCRQAGEPGTVVLFQVESRRPVTLTFSFTPELKRMWPAANYNAPSPEWVREGYYLLHTDSDELAGAVAMPGTQPGILAPYQERPKEWPLQLILSYDPARDGARYFPLLMAAATNKTAATSAALRGALRSLAESVPARYSETAAYYDHFFDQRVIAETPDPHFNQALAWAEIAIDQLRVRHASPQYGEELGLVAGLYSSGDSNRPGFGWFFGRDSLYTLYATDSYGDWALTRAELAFLLKRQRADGKIMHEYSQTAELVDWPRLPYEYAAADATPLLLMAAADYAGRSGDAGWVQEHWAELAKAWQFERTRDADGDGIYDNAQGTGWVESWPPGMPKQEVYLAALDVQASQAYARLAALAGKPDDGAAERARSVAATLEREYAQDGEYAFSQNGAGLLDRTATVYPAVAWWDGGYALAGDRMFARWASAEFSTDWGVRDVGEREPLYDPISYHQGSVWPLFTGWAAMAEYRTGRPLAGYTHLMETANLTWAQDLGAVTELLSGQFFVPLGRSTTHQLWSSAMVLTPALRGLFGVSFDAGALHVAPQLPAEWPGAVLRHVPAGAGMRATLRFERRGAVMEVRAEGEDGAKPPVLAGPPGSRVRGGVLAVPLPGAELAVPAELPLPGAATAQLKVVEQHTDAHSASWTLEALGGAEYTLPLRENGIARARVEGAELVSAASSLGGSVPAAAAAGPALRVQFPPGQGYVRQNVIVRW